MKRIGYVAAYDENDIVSDCITDQLWLAMEAKEEYQTIFEVEWNGKDVRSVKVICEH